MNIGPAEFEKLRSFFSGTILTPDNTAYDDTRKVHNGLIDKRPAVILVCNDKADVVAAVNFAREEAFEVSIRGGGHNVAGRAVCEGGVMIDLAQMKRITVDPSSRSARAQPGVTWGEFNRETQIHGLATTGGVVSSTGIAGLTLGGGLGFLMGKYGLTVDNLLSAEVVTADGRVLTASETENADLFWALRGGGGNFGVVTDFEYRVHEVGPSVTGGFCAYSLDDAEEMLRFYRDFVLSMPDELFVLGALVHSPDGSGIKLAAMVAAHCGEEEKAEKDVAPLRQFGKPVLDNIASMSYESLNAMFDAANPAGLLNYWKSGFFADLADDAIDIMVDQFAKAPSPLTGLFLEPFHGAAIRVDPEATAFSLRRRGLNFAIVSQWTDTALSDENIAWTRETFDALKPLMETGSYVNYIDSDGSEQSVEGAYGKNFARLREIKRRYDPANFFHMNQNIPPADS
jgi:FAD/FMN-containing dehydrogenase